MSDFNMMASNCSISQKLYYFIIIFSMISSFIRVNWNISPCDYVCVVELVITISTFLFFIACLLSGRFGEVIRSSNLAYTKYARCEITWSDSTATCCSRRQIFTLRQKNEDKSKMKTDFIPVTSNRIVLKWKT